MTALTPAAMPAVAEQGRATPKQGISLQQYIIICT
jgi:hypothetical protein